MYKSEEDVDALELVSAIVDVTKVVWLRTLAVFVATDEALETFSIEYADDAVVLELLVDADKLEVVDTLGIGDDTDCKVTAASVDFAGIIEVEVSEEL